MITFYQIAALLFPVLSVILLGILAWTNRPRRYDFKPKTNHPVVYYIPENQYDKETRQ